MLFLICLTGLVKDRFQTQDARNIYPGSVTHHQTPQNAMTITTTHHQQLPPPQQHQVIYNMAPQQQTLAPSVTSQQLTMNNPSLSVYANSSTKPNVEPRQQQPPLGMPINATVQPQMPGTGPINIDLGKIWSIIYN